MRQFNDLQSLLNTPSPIHDIDQHGSIYDLIQNQIAPQDKSQTPRDASFLVTDLTTIVKQHDLWVSELPMVEPFYAFKSNPDPTIVHLLATLGCGFDCATKGELQSVLHELGPELSFYERKGDKSRKSLSMEADKIVYANPAKMKTHIEYAARNGVTKTTFDGADELIKLAEVQKKILDPQGKRFELLLRITTDDKKSVCSFSNKFGCPVDDAPELLDLAKKLGLHVLGVSFHVGSGCGDKNAYATAFEHAGQLFAYADQIGLEPMTMVDVGGGFPGDKGGYGGPGMPTFSQIAGVVRHSIQAFRDKFAERELRFIAEPGRFFVSASTTVATQVYARKNVKHSSSESTESIHQVLYVDDGIYGTFNNVIYDHFEPKPISLNSKIGEQDRNEKMTVEEQLIPTTVFGPTCDGLDQLCSAENTELERVETGNWLVFENMGAYTHTASFVFNGYTHVPERLICISSVALDAETSTTSAQSSGDDETTIL